LIFSNFIYAKAFKKIKIGIGAGPTFSNVRFLVTFEPAYRISDKLSIGIRFEYVNLTRHYGILNSGENDVIYSYTIDMQYYFSSNRNIKPFFGAGLGEYREGFPTVISYETKLGFYPRIGFDIRHFNLAMDINITTFKSVPFKSYVGIRVGGFLGGGKK